MNSIEMDKLLQQALKLYDLQQPRPTHIRHNENMTYQITDMDKKYLLRIHKAIDGFLSTSYSDYSHMELVQSEIDIISSLKRSKVLVQTPISGLNGNIVQTISNNIPVTMIEWIEGETIEKTGTTKELYFNAGKMMAEMHLFFALNKADHINRYSYDQMILPKIAIGVEDAARLEILKLDTTKTLLSTLDEMRRRFDELDNIQDKHIIHGDLNTSNVIIDEKGHITPIDFGLCGYGHFYMDINIFNGDMKFSCDLIEGYKSVRNCEIIPRYMELHAVLGIILFIGAQYRRATKDMDWFPGKVDEWCSGIFTPFINQTSIITI